MSQVVSHAGELGLQQQRGAPRLLRRLRARIIAVAVGSTAIALACFSLSLTLLALDATELRLNDLLQSAMRGPAGATCLEHPTTFGIKGEQSTTLFAYDVVTLKSANPKAPPLDEGLKTAIADMLAAGKTSAAKAKIGTGAFVATKLATSGPCSLLVVSWPTAPAVPPWKGGLMTALFFMILGVAAAAGIVFVVRPTLVRIGRLSRAAALVGKPDYEPGATTADELGQIEAALDEAHARVIEDAAERARRHVALTEHLEHVAHDLRTPIASLQLKLERLGTALALDAPAATLVTEAMEDTLYMTGLTDNLRVAARLQDGLDPSAALTAGGDLPVVDLGDVVDRVGARLRVLADRKDLSLEWARPDDPCLVRCQPTMATQLVQNLVQNAVAYGAPSGHVAVVLETRNDQFSLKIVDDGPGVPPEDLPRLTGRTFRSDEARTRDAAGTGLGLAIANEIAVRSQLVLRFEANAPKGLVATLEGRLLL